MIKLILILKGLGAGLGKKKSLLLARTEERKGGEGVGAKDAYDAKETLRKLAVIQSWKMG